ncbi:MFS transporter [Pandoraea sp. NPDC087047]|uniref:MFS transporter n=1 Tax=Pandoraea sp. NPDC087047 TaxID=3364390 RepID=UPI0038236CF3
MSQRAISEEYRLLAGLFVSRAPYYALIPYLPLLLARLDFDAGSVGGLLSAAAFFAAVVSVLIGPLADIYPIPMVLRSLALTSAALSLTMAISIGRFSVFFASAGLIILRSAIDTLVKTQIAKNLSGSTAYESMMKSRYFLANLAALIGPAIYSVLDGSRELICGLLAFGCVVLAFCLTTKRNDTLEAIPLSRSRALDLAGAGLDKGLLVCVAHGAFLFYVLSQITIVLPQYFVSLSEKSAGTYISIVVSWSAVLIVVLHPVYQKFSSRMSRRNQMIAGSMLVVLSQIVLCGLGRFTSDVHLVIAAATAFTAGELFLFPLYSVVLSRLASQTTQGTYAGLGSLYLLGSAVGPFVGIQIMQHLGIFYVFFSSALIALAAMLAGLAANLEAERRSSTA